jgi:class 3 adenylate cyclase
MELGSLNEELLEAGLSTLEAARPWSPRVVSKLESLIRGDDELALFRVNPIRFASERGIDEDETIDLFLHSTRAGLFEMEWDVVCSSCSNVFKSFRKLEQVDPHFQCSLCNMENSASLDEFIQVSFTISPNVRAISMHRPEDLPIDLLLFVYRYSRDARAIYDGATVAEVLKQWTRELVYVAPGETVVFETDIAGGWLVCREVVGPTTLAFQQTDELPPRDLTVALQLVPDGMVAPDVEFDQRVLTSPIGRFVFPHVHSFGPGSITVECTNTTDRRRSFWAVRYPALDDIEIRRVEFGPYLSGKRLINNDTFHKLFRAEIPPGEEGLAIDDITYLFTDLVGSTAMYDLVGDLTAYNLVRLHFEVLNQTVIDHNGVVVKTIGDAIMASFLDPIDAVSAALDMVERLDAFNRDMSADLQLKVGIHRGHSVAVNLNDRLDYFGQNVNIAARTQQIAESGVLITGDIADSKGVRELLEDHTLKPIETAMKGVGEDIPVFRVDTRPTS